MEKAAMELKHAGFLSLIVMLSFVVSGTAARPITGTMSIKISAPTTTDMKVDRRSQELTTNTRVEVNKLIPESTLADAEVSDHGVADMDKLTVLNLEDAGVTHEERMLAATVQDYGDPSSNENPKYGDP